MFKANQRVFSATHGEGAVTENLIFYPHTRTFCFGWRNPVSKEVRAELVEKLKQFPFDFEIK